jgi:hypothetical protein
MDALAELTMLELRLASELDELEDYAPDLDVLQTAHRIVADARNELRGFVGVLYQSEDD